jgi:hypothetical protein
MVVVHSRCGAWTQLVTVVVQGRCRALGKVEGGGGKQRDR